MRITTAEPDPFFVLKYSRVKPRGRGVEDAELPFYWVCADRLPLGLNGCIITSDLQGMVSGKGARQLGLTVVETCVELLVDNGMDPKRFGVLLAGDFHSDVTLRQRGGHGDVRAVWSSFLHRFRWVCGVAGNHDTFGDDKEFNTFLRTPRQHLLHGTSVVVDGIHFGGVCGILGSSDKPWRISDSEHAKRMNTALRSSPQVLLLHEGPSIKERNLAGNDVVRTRLEASNSVFVICGHSHWPGNSIQTLSNGTRVLNTDGKVIIVRPNPETGR